MEPLASGFDVALKTPVDRVQYEAEEGAIVSVGATNFEADFVVCTIPLGVLKAGNISFDPPLPKQLAQSIDRIPMGSVTKLAMKFDTTFWPVDVQYFGVMNAEKGRWTYLFNYRTFSDANILMPLSFGNYAFVADAMGDEEMLADAMDVLREVFGAHIPWPVETLATHWSTDPFTLGAYSYAGFGSTPDDFNAFAKPVAEVLFFAGEHTDFTFHGTVHGALLTGRRAAEQIDEIAD